MTEEYEYLTTEDACIFLGLKKNSFYNCINRGEIAPANPQERPYYFLKADLERWKANRDRKKNLKKRYRISSKAALYPNHVIILD